MSQPERYRGHVVVGAAEDDDKAEEIENEAALRSPLVSAWNDVVVLAQNLPYLPNLVLPLRRAPSLPGVPPAPPLLLWDYPIVGLLTAIELPMLLGAIPALVLLPGWAFVLIYGGLALLILAICQLIWGPVLVASQTTGFDPERFERERWLFFNGIATGERSVQKSVNNIAATFERPVTGVYNKSTGIIGDLVECLIQRSFGYASYDVRVAFEALRKVLLDEQVDKVVVIAHSQGGIICSMALDHLYTVMPAHVLSKLEIYTFGSAAAHFHDPLTKQMQSTHTSQVLTSIQTESPTALSRQTTLSKDSQTHAAGMQPSALDAPTFLKGRLITRVEHYCNGRDLVPRWGVLYHVERSSGSMYAGRVISHENASGHLFDQHYLLPMLPRDRIHDTRDAALFLNHIVRFSEPGVLRAKTWSGSLPRDHDGNILPAAGQGAPRPVTVRELTRLWRYVGGSVPDDDDA